MSSISDIRVLTHTHAEAGVPVDGMKETKMTDARIPDHCAWAARGHWSRAYDAAEAEIARLTSERDTARAETAMAYAVAAEAAYQWWDDEGAQELRETVRSLTPAHATAALADRDRAEREHALRDAAAVCDKNGQISGWVSRDAIIAMIETEGK